MFNSKTYFEQVPLEFVKHIVEAQMRMEAAGETLEGIDKEVASEDLPEAEGRSLVQFRTVAQVRSLD
jgi:hypothetical protein